MTNFQKDAIIKAQGKKNKINFPKERGAIWHEIELNEDDFIDYFNEYTNYIDEPNEIIGVLEDNTHCGYRKASSMNELLTSTGVYYYDRGLNKLYIRNTRNTDPNIDTIIVQTK